MHRLIIAFLLIAGPSFHALPAGSSPEIEIEPHRFESEGGETVAAELGNFQVPENRDVEDSRTITLRFVRFPSTAEKPGPPIVYLAGGPGGSGTDAARGSRFPLFMALRKYGDVIAFDQRGTGMSEPDLGCTETYALPFDEPLSESRASAILAASAARCAERLGQQGVDLSGYDTRESAADLDALRRVLGAEKITLWGISYGTHLALATMKDYPDAVDRVILAGVEPLDQTLKLPFDQQRLLERIAALASSDPVTKEKTPDLLGSIESLLNDLEKNPRKVSITDPRSGMTVPVVVGKLDLQSVLASMLRGPDSFAAMPDLVYRLEGGDWLALGLLSAGQRFGRLPGAMGLAMDCASGASKDWVARIERESRKSLLGDAINSYMPEICAGLEVPDLGDEFRGHVRSAIPALLISGTLDGRTPAANAERVAKHLEKSQHLIIDGAGHSDPLFLSSPKILEAIEAFLEDRPIPQQVIELENPVDFIEPREVAEVAPETLSKYVGEYEIAPGNVRRVILAGELLFTQRGEGRHLPIRPMSETDFFYEGMDLRIRFDLDAEGRVTGMTMFSGGSDEGEKAVRK